jgi:hypothetical protein
MLLVFTIIQLIEILKRPFLHAQKRLDSFIQTRNVLPRSLNDLVVALHIIVHILKIKGELTASIIFVIYALKD